MMRLLESYGQLSPIVVVLEGDRWELIDGFKRLGAARKLPGMDRLVGRRIEADGRTAKAAIYGLNRAGGRTREIEEAWIVHALVRNDGLTQVEVAELLGLPPAGLAGEARTGRSGRCAGGIVDRNRGAATGAVACGQPGRHSGAGSARRPLPPRTNRHR